MLNVFEVADLLVTRAQKHADDVDLVCYYGSYAKGTQSEGSDLDIFYTPAEGKNPPIGKTFLVEGVLFDFWAIRWPTLEGFATGELRGWSAAPSLVLHATPLLVRNEAAQARLDKLKQTIADLQKPESREHMVRRALRCFREVKVALGNLHLAHIGGDVGDMRHAGWELVSACWECLAIANQVLFDGKWTDLPEKVDRMRHKPEGLSDAIVAVTTSSAPASILAAGDALAAGTRRVLLDLQAGLPSAGSAPGWEDQNYPELKAAIDKVPRACSLGDSVAASHDAWSAQREVLATVAGADFEEDLNLPSDCRARYTAADIPDLTAFDPLDLPGLASQAGLQDRRLRAWLTERSVDLCEYETIDDLRRSPE